MEQFILGLLGFCGIVVLVKCIWILHRDTIQFDTIQLDKKTSTIRASQAHFYVARDKDGDLNLFLNKPSRSYNLNKWKQYNFYKLGENKHKWIATRIVEDDYFKDLGLNPTDFKGLKWEDEPVEVFLNLEN